MARKCPYRKNGHARLTLLSASSYYSAAPLAIMERMRVFIVANTQKPQVQVPLDELTALLCGRAELVGVETSDEGDLSQIQADLVMVLGGDGTLLSAPDFVTPVQISL